MPLQTRNVAHIRCLPRPRFGDPDVLSRNAAPSLQHLFELPERPRPQSSQFHHRTQLQIQRPPHLDAEQHMIRSDRLTLHWSRLNGHAGAVAKPLSRVAQRLALTQQCAQLVVLHETETGPRGGWELSIGELLMQLGAEGIGCDRLGHHDAPDHIVWRLQSNLDRHFICLQLTAAPQPQVRSLLDLEEGQRQAHVPQLWSQGPIHDKELVHGARHVGTCPRGQQ
mmetsp:Transcript_1855/g.5506  ORF Transcript_1855/g.5506 Transcript_1855/m.5506 type:complete len:224 (-) Transcript_1855:242-913(-)